MKAVPGAGVPFKLTGSESKNVEIQISLDCCE